jgi:hypothetical protein
MNLPLHNWAVLRLSETRSIRYMKRVWPLSFNRESDLSYIRLDWLTKQRSPLGWNVCAQKGTP